MISLIITASGRKEHLKNLLTGVERSTIIPDEIIIVTNDVKKSELPQTLPIKLFQTHQERFDIGMNRNRGAELAQYDNLFFLDVDCIPSREYFETLSNVLIEKGGLCMGTPKYLLNRIETLSQIDNLDKLSIFHPVRPQVYDTHKEENYALFWSLCFAINKYDFDTLGGFHSEYIGYGAEDTDFAFVAKECNIEFYLSPAIVYHQQHPIYRPPVNHLQDIVKNSNTFYSRWKEWPMVNWLKQFKELNYIEWSNDSSKPINIKRLPKDKEIEKFRVENAPFV